ncbi:DUF2238 domain-containing protein [Sphingomonas montana]|uniref:DUF2238 domain-containing protein n=1 Tax=Sphingomonas montana TaxID=1843236 RepID=UPI00096D2B81|nr:DUF2238 domain-containing protein [Sphingomonas montana]
MTDGPAGGRTTVSRLPALQVRLLWLLAVAMVAGSWGALYPRNTVLQTAPTLILLLAAAPLLRRWPMSDAAVGRIVLFFLLHTLGARYSYSFVPYDDWARRLTGQGLSGMFGMTRNHYDRLVHLAFGLLAVRPVRELLVRYGDQTPRHAAWAAVGFVLAASALYEVFEWLLAVGMSPADAEAYNGQQGDPFDAQKDMAIAALGAMIAVAPLRSQRDDRP